MIRRTVLGAALLAAIAAPVCAQTYPAKPITIVVGFAAGAANDVVARVLSAELAPVLGSIVVENRTGADGNIAGELVKRAAPDGHTLWVAPSAHPILAALKPQPFDFEKDFEPIVAATSLPLFMAVNVEAFPATSVQDAIARAKAAPGKFNYGSAGNGSPHHLAMELLKLRAGIDVTHVPYRGGAQAAIDLLAGRVQMMITGYPALAPHMQSGKLKILATAGARRSVFQPDVPTMTEAGVPDFALDTWIGVLAPRGTPARIVQRLNAEINKVLQSAAARERFARMAMEPIGGTPAEFAKLIADDMARYREIVKAANIKTE